MEVIWLLFGWPITKDIDEPIKTQKNTRFVTWEQVGIGFGFVIKWREFFG